MKYSLVLITVFILYVLISCSQAKQDSEQTQKVPVLPQNQEELTTVNKEPIQPVEDVTTKQPTTEQNNTKAMLNPPHGQPYHRCDIPVGAPLNSQEANTTLQSTNNQVQAIEPKSKASAASPSNNYNTPTIENAKRLNTPQSRNSVPSNNGIKPQLNPPHGQPFHRCEIPVGSPLP